jgi:ribosome-associated heat shock protein Hsp15
LPSEHQRIAFTLGSMPKMAEGDLRIDKWLWAARFFKTRSIAADAVEGGKAKLNDQHVKPAKTIRIGDMLDIAIGDQQWTVVVRGINAQRRPASEARLLFEETAESLARRLRALELRKLAPAPGADLRGRPSKRDARLIRRFERG